MQGDLVESLVDDFKFRYGYDLVIKNDGENRWLFSDNGPDGRGVQVVGTPRHNWLKSYAKKYGLAPLEHNAFRFETIDDPETPAPAQEEAEDDAPAVVLEPLTIAPPLTDDIERENDESINYEENAYLYEGVQEEA